MEKGLVLGILIEIPQDLLWLEKSSLMGLERFFDMQPDTSPSVKQSGASRQGVKANPDAGSFGIVFDRARKPSAQTSTTKFFDGEHKR